MTFEQFLNQHRNATDTLRLGQRFANTYLKDSSQFLFLRDDGTECDIFYVPDGLAERLIREYLQELQYWPDMPPALEK